MDTLGINLSGIIASLFPIIFLALIFFIARKISRKFNFGLIPTIISMLLFIVSIIHFYIVWWVLKSGAEYLETSFSINQLTEALLIYFTFLSIAIALILVAIGIIISLFSKQLSEIKKLLEKDKSE